MTRDEWIVTFAAELGVPALSSAEIGALLDLAAVAAHASERTAAPLSCWPRDERSRRSSAPLRALRRRSSVGQPLLGEGKIAGVVDAEAESCRISEAGQRGRVDLRGRNLADS